MPLYAAIRFSKVRKKLYVIQHLMPTRLFKVMLSFLAREMWDKQHYSEKASNLESYIPMYYG